MERESATKSNYSHNGCWSPKWRKSTLKRLFESIMTIHYMCNASSCPNWQYTTCTANVRVCYKEKMTTRTVGTSEIHAKIVWEVQYDSRLRYVDAVPCAMTVNYHHLDRCLWLWTNQSCKVQNYGSPIALHSSTRSNRVDFWSNFLSHGQSLIELDVNVPYNLILIYGRLLGSQILNWLSQLQACSATQTRPAMGTGDAGSFCKYSKLRTLALKCATTMNYRPHGRPRYVQTTTTTKIDQNFTRPRDQSATTWNYL